MKLLTLVLCLLSPLLVLASPLELAQTHIGKSMLDNYLYKPLPQVIRLVEELPANQRRSIGKSILLNLYGHNFDTTLMHDSREVVSFSRVFYDEESAPEIFAQIEKFGKKVQRVTKIQSGPKPGTFHEFDFKEQGVFFRFNKNKKIQVITIKKIKPVKS